MGLHACNAGSLKKENDDFQREILQYNRYTHRAFAIQNVTLIDGTGGNPGQNQSVLIEDGLIKAVGETGTIRLPRGTKVVDGTGKTLMPGLVGMHNHMHMPGIQFLGEWGALLYLAAGVTTMQTCGSASPVEEIRLVEQIDSGLVEGPEIFTSAPYFTGPGGSTAMIIPENDTQIRDTVAYWAEKGVRWFKVYRHTRPEDLQVIINEVHRHGGKVTGHLCSITFKEATEMGIDGIEHGLNSATDFSLSKNPGTCDASREFIDHIDVNSQEVGSVLRKLIEQNVFLTSTVAIYEASIPMRAHAREESVALMPQSVKQAYDERRARIRQDSSEAQVQSDRREARLQRILGFEKRFFDMGGHLVAGVDAGRHVLPGFGDQRNYELMVTEGGFLPAEAIQVMTQNGARALHRNDIGHIAKGMKADLVLLDGDLTENPEVIYAVEAVYKNGRPYDADKLLVKAMKLKNNLP
ncbi:amidohydrolase family protein [Roseivirga sp. BDSF3-8]|uniref:amidohydrolase family protein n=1 Tax=Roseivirga sp. BDSF3-8 TaxID=3241598 RepID=UPI0035325637